MVISSTYKCPLMVRFSEQSAINKCFACSPCCALWSITYLYIMNHSIILSNAPDSIPVLFSVQFSCFVMLSYSRGHFGCFFMNRQHDDFETYVREHKAFDSCIVYNNICSITVIVNPWLQFDTSTKLEGSITLIRSCSEVCCCYPFSFGMVGFSYNNKQSVFVILALRKVQQQLSIDSCAEHFLGYKQTQHPS